MNDPRMNKRFTGSAQWITLAVIAVVVIVVVLWFSMHPGFGRQDTALCKVGYARARSAQDTAMVDAEQSNEKSPGALACGALRKSGEIK